MTGLHPSDEIVDFVEHSDMWQEPYVDILKKAPETTIDDAYEIQRLVIARALKGVVKGVAKGS